jgi:hypothetical protein
VCVYFYLDLLKSMYNSREDIGHDGNHVVSVTE